MKIIYLNNDRVVVDMLTPNPIISIPINMWDEGLKNFSGNWVKCDYEKSTTENDRVLFTVYGSESYEKTLDKKLCLYKGVKDTTGNNWAEFEDLLNDSETSEYGFSYREIESEDTRQWYEFHIYEETILNSDQRPIILFDESIINDL